MKCDEKITGLGLERLVVGPVLPLVSCVTLGQSMNLALFLFPFGHVGGRRHLKELVQGLSLALKSWTYHPGCPSFSLLPAEEVMIPWGCCDD